MAQVLWENAPDAHDYPAASSYLSLLVDDDRLRARIIAQLQAAPVAHYKAKDLLRASALPLLSAENPHVASDLRKIRKGRALSPVLLLRGDLLARLSTASGRRLSPGLRELLGQREHRHPVPPDRPARRRSRHYRSGKESCACEESCASKESRASKENCARQEGHRGEKDDGQESDCQEGPGQEGGPVVTATPAPEAAAQPESPSA